MTAALSADQAHAVSAFRQWWHTPDAPQVFRLDGHAGTGKTTVVRAMVDSVACTAATVVYAAPTGKAAARLRERGCFGARTLHSLLYFRPDEAVLRDGELPSPGVSDTEREQRDLHHKTWVPRLSGYPKWIYTEFNDSDAAESWFDSEKRPEFHKLGSPVELVVVDEASMVHPFVGEDLLREPVRILVVGDSAQLPPVKGEQFFTDDNRFPVDAHLTTVHRQSKGSGILAKATDIRSGRGMCFGSTRCGQLNGLWVVDDPSEVEDAAPLEADQILCATNSQRHAINTSVRASRGFTVPLVIGDKLVALKNVAHFGVFNGTLWTVVAFKFVRLPKFGNVVIAAMLQPNDVDPNAVPKLFEAPIRLPPAVAKAYLAAGGDTRVDKYGGTTPDNAYGLPFGFAYGYAITVHKAQGSEWDRVLIAGAPNWCPEDWKGDGARWAYTALTRAKSAAIYVRDWPVPTRRAA